MTLIYLTITLIALWLLGVSLMVFGLWRHYKKLTKGAKGEDLRKIWEEHLEKAKRAESRINELGVDLEKLKKEGDEHFQKIGVVRFNPFNETGGNQSFAVALLDGRGNGVVLSNLHGRGLTRVYAKPIKDFGPSGFELSEEEKNAVSIAKNA